MFVDLSLGSVRNEEELQENGETVVDIPAENPTIYG
jgi:hypothetical protein